MQERWKCDCTEPTLYTQSPAVVLCGGQKDFLNSCGSTLASLSRSHLPLCGVDGNHGGYYGVFLHFIQAIWGLCGWDGLAIFFFKCSSSLVKIFYGNYFRKRVMTIMMIILIIGLLCEIFFLKSLHKHNPEQARPGVGHLARPLGAAGAVSLVLWAVSANPGRGAGSESEMWQRQWREDRSLMAGPGSHSVSSCLCVFGQA